MTTPEDPLSQVLSLAQAHSAVSTGLEARGHWAIRVSPTQLLKCNAIRAGQCWLDVTGTRTLLETGDCFLVAPDHAFVLTTDPTLAPVAAEDVFAGSASAPYAQLDGGDGAGLRCIGGRMEFPGAAELLISALPPVAVLRAGTPAADRIRWLLDRLEDESTQAGPGSAAMSSALMQLVFIELLRGVPEVSANGWLAAVADPKLGLALQEIHRDPGRAWRLHELAKIALMSRSRFAKRFHDVVGRSAMDYLLHWRMTLAKRQLARPGVSVASIAEMLGYSSESAFGAAYRRATGKTPRGHRLSK
ncbi:AraC family transcriptional regulator [Stenotrophomonas sp. 278]|uniref:AraC family transcriptional regulator n=1 Tax=Stenotrophomonas sp. 278 TaxID=2479851 RepID=UPI000F660BCB|nr:AraC family transcriptional regulator [Stenotrophomonas sp. 278]RRU12520.1 AraC family transcriptional regulator [Stenotrophomonas sp. 278]